MSDVSQLETKGKFKPPLLSALVFSSARELGVRRGRMEMGKNKEGFGRDRRWIHGCMMCLRCRDAGFDDRDIVAY